MKTKKVKKHEGLCSKLPPEIWEEIGKRLHSRLDFTRFRSVCTTWRSSLPPPTRFPLSVPTPPVADWTKYHNVPFFIKEHTFYCYDTESKSEANQPSRMLMVLEEVDQGGKFLPRCFSPVKKVSQNLYRFTPPIPQISRISFVCKTYQLNMALPMFTTSDQRVEGKWRFHLCPYVRRLVLISSSPTSVDANYARGCDLTAVVLSNGGTLSVLRLGNPLPLNWETDFCTYTIKDIINYNGKLFAVDRFGRVYVMDYHSLRMTQIMALPKFTYYMMQFVETLGHLYLFFVKAGSNHSDLKVYKLRSELQQWVEVEDLGDQVFFVYNGHTFSVPRNVFADTGLMDLRYKMSPNVLDLTLIFSHGADDDGDKDRVGTGYCTIPMVSKPCISPRLVKAAANTSPTTFTSSVLAEFENTSVAWTNYGW